MPPSALRLWPVTNATTFTRDQSNFYLFCHVTRRVREAAENLSCSRHHAPRSNEARVAAGFDLVFGWCLVALSGDCYAGSFLFAAHPWGYERAAVRAYRTRFRASILGRTVFCEKKEPARKDTNIGYDREIYVFSWELGCGGRI